MVGVLVLALWGMVAFITLRTTRNFLLNLEGAKRTGLPYAIGRKLALKMLYAVRCTRRWHSMETWRTGDPSHSC